MVITLLCLGIVLISVIAVVMLLMFGGEKVEIEAESDEISIVYKYGEKNINEKLSIEQAEKVKQILQGKKAKTDNPSCGFTQDISLKFGNTYFCIARDTCPIIQYNGKYITVSENEREEIEQIFKEYGATFPCV